MVGTRNNSGKNNPMYGRKHTEETKKKIGLKSLGRKHSEEWKKSHSRKLIGLLAGEKNPMFGKVKEQNPNWRGGRFKTKDGYIMVRTENNEYELEHRLVMGKHLNRKLKTEEVVHHKNGKTDDNELKNLELLTNAEHARKHESLKEINEFRIKQATFKAVISSG